MRTDLRGEALSSAATSHRALILGAQKLVTVNLFSDRSSHSVDAMLALLEMVDDSRRSALAQERSRETRRRIVRAALKLWSERGYADGIDSTTAAEIAEAAGVSKATFYLHFSRKEDVLAEMSFTTTDTFDREATALLGRDLPTSRVLDRLHAVLAKHVEAADRAAVARAMAEARRQLLIGRVPTGPAFVDTYARVLLHGKARRDLPATLDVEETAQMLYAVASDAIEQWAIGELKALRPALVRRSTAVIAGCSTAP